MDLTNYEQIKNCAVCHLCIWSDFECCKCLSLSINRVCYSRHFTNAWVLSNHINLKSWLESFSLLSLPKIEVYIFMGFAILWICSFGDFGILWICICLEFANLGSLRKLEVLQFVQFVICVSDRFCRGWRTRPRCVCATCVGATRAITTNSCRI